VDAVPRQWRKHRTVASALTGNEWIRDVLGPLMVQASTEHCMTLPCDEQDKALFQASTEITIGNGKKATFWQNRWLQGKALKDIVRLLFNLAHFKRRSVEKELKNNNWIQSVRCMGTTAPVYELLAKQVATRKGPQGHSAAPLQLSALQEKISRKGA
jgi:hypothetical protein